jgi:hypothetical protein
MSSTCTLPVSCLPSKFNWADDEDEEFDFEAWKANADIAAPAASSLPPLQVAHEEDKEPAYVATVTTYTPTIIQPEPVQEAESAPSSESDDSHWTPYTAQRCLSWRAINDNESITPAYPNMSWGSSVRRNYASQWMQMKVRAGADCRYPLQYRFSKLSIVAVSGEEDTEFAPDSAEEERKHIPDEVSDFAPSTPIGINFIQEDELDTNDDLPEDAGEPNELTQIQEMMKDLMSYIDEDDVIGEEANLARVTEARINFIQPDELHIYENISRNCDITSTDGRTASLGHYEDLDSDDDLAQGVAGEEVESLPADTADLAPIEELDTGLDSEDNVIDSTNEEFENLPAAAVDLAPTEDIETGQDEGEHLNDDDDLASTEEAITDLVQEEDIDADDNLAPTEELEISSDTIDLAPNNTDVTDKEPEHLSIENTNLASYQRIRVIGVLDEDDWSDTVSDSGLGTSLEDLDDDDSRSTSPDSGYNSDKATSASTKADYRMPEKTPVAGVQAIKLVQEPAKDANDCSNCLQALSSSWCSMSSTTLTSIGLGVLSAGALALWYTRRR